MMSRSGDTGSPLAPVGGRPGSGRNRHRGTRLPGPDSHRTGAQGRSPALSRGCGRGGAALGGAGGDPRDLQQQRCRPAERGSPHRRHPTLPRGLGGLGARRGSEVRTRFVASEKIRRDTARSQGAVRADLRFANREGLLFRRSAPKVSIAPAQSRVPMLFIAGTDAASRLSSKT